MNISPTEAEEALDAIQTMVQKTRQGISSSGAYNFLIVWGFVWLFGFSASHFAPNQIAGYVWMGSGHLGRFAFCRHRFPDESKYPQSFCICHREKDRLVLAAIVLLLHYCDWCGLANRWQGNCDGNHLICHDRLDGPGLIAFLLLYLVGISHHSPGIDWLLLAARYFLPLDGRSWWRGNDHPGYLYSK